MAVCSKHDVQDLGNLCVRHCRAMGMPAATEIAPSGRCMHSRSDIVSRYKLSSHGRDP